MFPFSSNINYNTAHEVKMTKQQFIQQKTAIGKGSTQFDMPNA
jgi:hypothetical protein